MTRLEILNDSVRFLNKFKLNPYSINIIVESDFSTVALLPIKCEFYFANREQKNSNFMYKARTNRSIKIH